MMTFGTIDFLARADIDRGTLEIWIEEEWLIPSGVAAEPVFSEGDLARVRLIHDLMGDLGVNAEGVSVIMHLVDQVHGLRHALSELSGAGQPNARS